jgi:formylmethanofuran dehydrogenase subunit E
MSSERFPAFFDQVPRLVVRDPLAEFLGAAEGGVLEYGYADAVRLAGHSCPTVASAYALAHHALTRLFAGELPVRGMVQVSFQHPLDEGVTGVIAAVVGLLSGSAQDGGFKGIAGRFVRRNLQHFGEHQPLALRFVRSDSGATVHAAAELSKVQPHPEMAELMRRCMRGEAAPAEAQRFAQLWQDRVRRVLVEHWDDPEVFHLSA